MDSNFTNNNKNTKMRLSESKPAAIGAMVLAVLVTILTFSLRTEWWAFIDAFFLFMAAFTYLVSVLIARYNRRAMNKLQKCAFVCFVLMILSLIGEYVAFQVIQ